MAFALVMTWVGYISLAGMVFGAGAEGYQANKQLPEIAQHIKDLNDANTDWNQKYAQLVGQMKDSEAQIKASIDNCLTVYDDTKSKLQSKLLLYNEHMRKIQMYGILFVLILFIMLIIKRFKLLD